MDKPIGFCYVIMQKWNLGEKYVIVYGPLIDERRSFAKWSTEHSICQKKWNRG